MPPRLAQVTRPPGVHGGLCNPSYWDGGVAGWLEDGSPPWRLLGPLEQPHLSLDQFQTPLRVQVGPGGSVVVIGTLLSDQIPTQRESVMLNHSCYVVLGLNWP